MREREFDGSHLTFDGMNPNIELREHQKNAVARVLYGGNTSCVSNQYVSLSNGTLRVFVCYNSLTYLS